MHSSNNCRFCNIIANKYKYADIDKPFVSNSEFVAVASIGALVEGWSLIIPKQHQLSMKAFYGSSEFQDIMTILVPKLLKNYGPLIAFEHGANCEGSSTSCGTDHAHLHLVPWTSSPLINFQNELRWTQIKASEISTKSKSDEYLFYFDISTTNEWKDPKGYLHILKEPVSQFFRKRIANQCGKLNKADYNKFPLLDIAQRTRRALALSFA